MQWFVCAGRALFWTIKAGIGSVSWCIFEASSWFHFDAHNKSWLHLSVVVAAFLVYFCELHETQTMKQSSGCDDFYEKASKCDTIFQCSIWY